jgi:GTP cyclohydrolase II
LLYDFKIDILSIKKQKTIKMIVKMAEGNLKTQYGSYREILYYDGQKEIVVMVLGDVENTEGVLCRIHSSCIYGHYFNSIECDCREQMALSQQIIEKEGKGILFLLDQEGKANGHFALMQSKVFKKKGYAQADAYEAVGFKRDARDFSKVAEILKELNVKSVSMLTDNAHKTETLTRHGITVLGTRAIEMP